MSMMEFLTYDLKVAALLAVFYMFYRLLLSHETFHRVNRVVLLLTAILSFVLPLCVITIHKTVVVDMPKANIDFGGMTMMTEEAEPQAPFWQTAAIVVFFIGLMVTLGYTLQSILRVWLLIRHSEQHPQNDGTSSAWQKAMYRPSVGCVTSYSLKATTRLKMPPYSPMNGDISVGVTRSTSSSLIRSPPCNGSILLCGCCAKTCVPSMSTRPMQRYSLKASICVSISICLSKKPSPPAGTLWPTALPTVPSKTAYT